MDEDKDITQEAAGRELPRTMAEARRDLDILREAVTEMPSDDPEKERSLRYIEMIDNERDNTGALKRKFFGLEMQALLSRKEMVEDMERMRKELVGGPDGRPIPRLEFGEDGRISIPEGENQSFIFMNMGELDRFNKEGGGHDVGDAALMQAEDILETRVYEALREAGVENAYDHFNVYRFDGNTFVASVREVPGDKDREDGARVRDVIERTLSEAGPKVRGVKEPAPLVAMSMDMKDAVELFHGLQSELEPGKRLTDPDQASRELFGMVAGYADHALDVGKFESRVNRVLRKLEDAGGDVEQVRPFFENYMKKMFADTELEAVEDFAALDRRRIPELALEYARRNLGGASDFEAVEAEAIGREIERVRARDVVSSRLREMRRPEAAGNGGRAQNDVVLAEVPRMTNGQTVMDGLLKRYKAAPKGSGEKEKYAREMAGLEYMIEFARRDPGTGLLERGVYYEDLESDIESGREASTVFVDMGFLKYFDKAGGRDVGNDALKLAADLMERAVEESGVEATVYRYAGDEFTIRISGGKEQADAFGEALDRLRFDESGEKRLAVPQGKNGADNGYFPTELVFNASFADREMAENVFADMKKAGAFTVSELKSERYVRNKKAEIMTALADKSVAGDKAVGRFEMLIGRMTDPRYKKVDAQVRVLAERKELEIQERLAGGEKLSSEEMRIRPESLLDAVDADEEDRNFWTQTEQMALYSGKAIFAEDGGANLLRAWAESGRPFGELRDEIEAFVEQSLEEAENADKNSRELRDRLIEAHVRADYFEGKVGELQERLDKVEGGNRALSDEIGVLKEMLGRAQEEKRMLVERRRDIGKAE